MFAVGDVVLHTSQGVCRVDDIRDEKFSGLIRTYYVLLPMGNNGKSTTYVPVDAPKSPIRELLSEEQIREVIHVSMNEKTDWIDNNNVRKSVFTEILRSDDMSKILSLIVCLYNRRETVLSQGKKFPVVDERIMAEAERKIHQEFSYTLSISEKDVPQYIKMCIAESKKEVY